MFKYFSVIGIRHENLQIKDNVIRQIFDSFYVEKMSKIYTSPSEDDRFSGNYINFAFQILSALNYEEFKLQTQQIESVFSSNQKKLVDFDVILQLKDDDLLYVDKTIDQYCHILVTLNDLIPNRVIRGITIFNRLKEHSNNQIFSEFVESSV